MIVDCFTFLNEVDLLRIRLRELGDIVSTFVIVEAGETHAGRRKPFIFESVRDRFAEFEDRIVYVKLDKLLPLGVDTEEGRSRLEAYNRNAIALGLSRLDCAPDDLVLISDIDEIPSRSALMELSARAAVEHRSRSWTLGQFFYKHFFDDPLDDGYNRRWWGGTVAVRHSALAEFSPQRIRREIGGGGRLFSKAVCRELGSVPIKNAGWHLSSFGGTPVRSYKLANYQHGLGFGEQTARVAMMDAAEVADLLDHGITELELRRLIDRSLGGNVPACVKADPLSFKHFFRCAYWGGR